MSDCTRSRLLERPATRKAVAIFASMYKEHIRFEDAALFTLLYLTGRRIGEVLALKWSDVDLENSKLYIRRSVWRGSEQTPKSRRSIRAKHLLPGLKNSLLHQRSLTLYKTPEDYVFANGAGRPLDPDDLRKRVLYPAMDKAGIERKMARAYGFHLFRHSAGTQMHEATGDLKPSSRRRTSSGTVESA